MLEGQLSAILVGDQSLLVECADILRARNHAIQGVFSNNPEIRSWAGREGIPFQDLAEALTGPLAFKTTDWLLSIGNLNVLPDEILALGRQGAVNFHDGPLPAYAGLNAPVWALIAGETCHAVTWHLIASGIDTGDILIERCVDIAPDDTALTLNARCYVAAIESFADLITTLESDTLPRRAQDIAGRKYFARTHRPNAGALLDFSQTAEAVVRLVRALDHGQYWNPLAIPKIATGGHVMLVHRAEIAGRDVQAPPGTVLKAIDESLTVATGTDAVLLGLRAADGTTLKISLPAPGTVLDTMALQDRTDLDNILARAARHDPDWRVLLSEMVPLALPDCRTDASQADWCTRTLTLPVGLDPARLPAAIALWALRMAGQTSADIAWSGQAHAAEAARFTGHLCPWVPLRAELPNRTITVAAAAAAFEAQCIAADEIGGFTLDLLARDPALIGRTLPALAITKGPTPIPGTAISILLGADALTFASDTACMTAKAADRLADRLTTWLNALVSPSAWEGSLAALPIHSAEEAARTADWNATEIPFDNRCLHEIISDAVTARPDAVALIHGADELSYADLDYRANWLAHQLCGLGIKPDTPVALFLERGIDLVTGALAILKAGGAYVPLDPTYPTARTAFCLDDSGAQVIVTSTHLAVQLPDHNAQLLKVDGPKPDDLPETAPDSGATPENLAYLVYTSGSTGQPKGVMVEHRNVANFLAAMDAYVAHDSQNTLPGVWLAVTSLSFDISVLELFWTLARGFKVVIGSVEDGRALSSDAGPGDGPPTNFSLYYWSNDDTPGRDKYRLLLDGAVFADNHGFAAVWTPERHFHAFGGPYPNPAITGAAVAAITSNLDVRAGSCVAPLHHPARIAEEWAVIDNLTNGRTGLAMASGWQPDDFVLLPVNTPPANKPALLKTIEQVRQLWRGEEVAFPRADGTMQGVITQPRPVSAELPVWVTTAGNPETWREAGQLGANVLTHLLGQSMSEIGEKVALYHTALAEAGHDPADFQITLMLHTFLATDREMARVTARGPMREYLRSATGLIKQYAWAFPAFKRPQGVDNPLDLDLGALEPDELEAILDFAFERYFNDSGLFGTIEDAMARVAEVRALGVTEIACLIDYGIPTDVALAGLEPLAEVVARCQAAGTAASDTSLAGLIRRHGVTHLQMTPSLARMMMGDPDATASLGQVRHLMLGGEAVPGLLVKDLTEAGVAEILNMYGPTETTIWSAVGPAEPGTGAAPLGQAVANTQLYVLDEVGLPVPEGVPGELWIGGAGVTRGYWQRPDLTAKLFRPDPFGGDGRIYCTGDLVRFLDDGRLAFLGRTDYQVKLRGHRIELGEIETAIAALGGVHEVVVIAREDIPGDLRLVAYTVPHTIDEAALKDTVAAALPAYMVPARIIGLDTMPLTPNGKIDRKALPAPGGGVSKRKTTPSALSTDSTEARLAGIWAQVLGIEKIGAQDHFFQLGGHSLLAVQASRAIRAAFGDGSVSIIDIFRYPVLADLARHIEGPDNPEDPLKEPSAESRADITSRRRALRAARVR